jgi:hypothetical protein
LNFFENYNKKFPSNWEYKPDQFAGIAVTYANENKYIKLSQEREILDLAKRIGLADAKPASSPMQPNLKFEPLPVDHVNPQWPYPSANGSLIWCIKCHPEISSSMSILGSYMHSYGEEQISAIKTVIRYLLGVASWGLVFRATAQFKLNKLNLMSYYDATWACDLFSSRSMSGYVVFICGNLISFASKYQPTSSSSSTDAEYMALAYLLRELLAIVNFYEDIDGVELEFPIPAIGDNSGAIAISNNLITNTKTKHIRIRFHFIREYVIKNIIQLHKCASLKNLADPLTKPTSGEYFISTRNQLIED